MKLYAKTRPASSVDVVVIGAGHCGLAMSHFLSARSIDHVVLERGEIANSWRHERWDSLRLLTPNWLTRLPGYGYRGDRPDDYMKVTEVADFIVGYAEFAGAPVQTETDVTAVKAVGVGYRVETNRGAWLCRAVVMASGAFNTPNVPALSAAIPDAIRQLTLRDYRNPDALDDSGVLIVGASATGLQLADEIQASGRDVTLAVGEHVRMPRTYRGKDIQYWMERAGLLDECYTTVDDIRRARKVPSPQLVGSDSRRTLDLNSLTDKGVRIAGRLAGVRDGKAQFSGSLRNVCALADLKMERMLKAIDEWIDANGYAEATEPTKTFAATNTGEPSLLGLDLTSKEIRTVIWATGFRPDYSWLDVPVLDRKGNVRHDGGVVDAPGLYIMGLPFLRRRKSSFIHGAEDDARDLSGHLAAYLEQYSQSRFFGVAV